jgi:predicted extracellular nuclease
VAQAQVVRDFVDALIAEDPAARVIVLGDLNDFAFAPPVEVLRAGATLDGDLDVLIEQLAPEERYSYVFEGNSQALDQILVSQALADVLVPGSYDVVHVNAEFADQASDHDPQLARFLLPAA